MTIAFVWPALAIAAAGLQVVRNAAQRDLTQRLGVWGAAYVRFIYGLPFALVWGFAIIAWRGASGGMSWPFWGWTALGAGAQAAATGLLVMAMKGRAFAVATALSKTEVLGSALVGVLLIGDRLSMGDWLGAAIGTGGVIAMAHVSVDRAALRAAFAGIGSGLLFSFSAVAYRAAAHDWGGDGWVGAAATLLATLCLQTGGGAALMLALAPAMFTAVLKAWRPSLIPGAAGAIASACLFSAFSLGPSAGAVKTVQLVDVLIAWGVSHRLMRERIGPVEMIGAGLVLAGAVAVLFA
jgi:drug/metabolite transporter (DMT)-like permease